MSVQTSRPEVVIVDEPSRDISVEVDLRRHVPRVALDWDDTVPSGQQWQVLDASMVFADISGFTALTERLATRGRIGAEELIETLNRVFGSMLSQAAIRGGELLKFGGDALLFLFRGEDHAARACRSAVDMRQALKEAAKIPTSVGKLKLSMSVGIHSGPVDLFLVGAPTRELLILGDAGTSTTEAEHAAVAGEILVTEGTAQHLPPGSTELRDDGLHRLKWRFTYPPEGMGPPTPEVTEERLRTLFPHALGEYLAERVPDPEHKIATIGFARFSGTDEMLREQGHEAVAAVMHETLSIFEEAMIAEGVTLLATDIDSDGGKLFMASGVPYTSEDDEGRMLRAMRAVIDHGTPLPVQIGVNRGHVFAAEVGTLNRSAYSAMGDTTNTAARIMSKADGGVLFAHPTVLEHSRTLFVTEQAGPFPMKGKAVPVLVYDVGEETGTRVAVDRSDLPLVGREEELATLRDALQRALSGEGGVMTVTASTGLGKSRLITEAMKDLDATVVTVRAEPYGMTSPYRMLRDPVRDAFRIERGDPQAMADQLLHAFDRLMPELRPLAPLLEDVVSIPLPPTAQASAIDAQFRPDRIADIILRLVERTVPGPFVLLVEEAHWADSASITTLSKIAAAAPGRPWAVVVARRTEGEGFNPDSDTVIGLGPLPPEVMHEIVIDITAEAPLRGHEVEGLVSRAQGNPLFLSELVRVFREVGNLDDVPENLHAALDAQIDALDPHSRRVLRYASVLGRSFRREVINEALIDVDLDLDDATVARLSEFLEPDGSSRLRFRNSMIRDAAYAGLAYRLRNRLHGAAGRAVEKLSRDLDADADTLSMHYWHSGDTLKTWRYARMAGDRAARAYANVDAAVQYARAADAARSLSAVSEVERSNLYNRLASVRGLAGLFEEAVDAYRAAIRCAGDDDFAAAALLISRAQLRYAFADYNRALRDLSNAEKRMEGEDSLEARRIRVRAGATRTVIRQEQQKPRLAVKEAQRVVDDARATEEYEALESLLMFLDIASLATTGEFGALTSEAMESARSNGRLSRVFTCLGNLGSVAYLRGAWAESIDYLEQARSTAEMIGDVVGVARIGQSLGEVLVILGRLDEAERVLDEALRGFRSLNVPSEAAYCQVQLGRCALARGDAQRAYELVSEAEIELERGKRPYWVLEAQVVRADALVSSRRPAEAIELLDSAVVTEEDRGMGLLAQVNRVRARALLGLDDLDAASVHIEQGLEEARLYELPPEEARLLLLRADLATRRGDDESAATDRQAAEAILHFD